MKTKQTFISLLLSSVLFISLFATLFYSVSAAECTHSWSVVEVNVDAHVSACSLCGASKSEAHTWNTAEQSCTYVDDHYHQQSCTGCKQVRIIPHGTKGSTTMGGWEAGFFNLYYWCRGCNTNATKKDIAAQYHATSASNCSSHEYKVLSYDGEGHILECRKCGTTAAKAAHNWTSIDSNGLATCTAGCKAYIEGSEAPEVSPEYPIEYYFSQRGPYTVSAQEFSDFTDPEGQFNHIKIWYPTDMTTTNNQWPTIVFCNGSGSGYGPDKDGKTLTDQAGYTALFEHFASWGFILVANNRPGCASSNATDTTLNYLLNRNTISGDLFYNKVDMDKIGIAGHSQGGTAVLQNLSGSTVTSNVNYTYECTQYYKAAWSASPQAYDNILKWTYTPENITCPTIMVCADSDWASSNDILTTNSGKMSGIPVVTAVRKNADHGAMVSIGKGYMIAWFRYALLGDCYAAQAFVENAELMNNATWQKQASQKLSQVTYHSYTIYESDSYATCNNVGTKTADCDFATFHGTEYTCNQSHTVSGDTYGNHQWIAATCTNPKTCSVCGATEGEALGHSYASVVTAPTCTTQGYTTHTCSRCSDSYKDDYTDAAGHSITQVEAKSPTCEEIGWNAYEYCSVCDYTTYSEISSKGHTEVIDQAVAPTCGETGLTEGAHCSCGKVWTAQEVIPATGLHSFAGAACTVCGAPKVVKATKDGTMTVDYGQILDLNGYNVTVNDPVETLKVINTSFMTNSGLQLDGEHPGSLTTTATVATTATDGNFWYLAVKEGDTYNFHPFNLAISRLGLNTLGKDGTNPAVCIEVMFIANDVAKAKLQAEGNDYGINKLSGDSPVFISAKSYAFGNVNGVKAYYDLSNSLTDYIDSEYKLQACIVIDGEEICNKIITVIPREVMKNVNDQIAGGAFTVTDSQETAIKGLMNTNTRINNIFSCYREGACTHEVTSGGKCLDCDE